jgi:hypothetical protein
MSNSSYLESAIRVSVYPSAWRAISGTLFAVSRASLPVILAVLVIETEPPVTEPLLVRLVLVFCLLPGLAAALIRRAFAVDVAVREAGIVSFYRRGRQVAVDLSQITAFSLWRLPLPGPGLTLWTASPGGPSRAYLLHADNLDGLIDKISALGRTPSFIESSPLATYARARCAAGLASWRHLFFKFGIFPLLPAVIFFRLHQYITHGSAFGEYQSHGLDAYLSTFAFYWIMMVVYLLFYASVWRILVEGASLASAWIRPSFAVTVRRWAERGALILYYGGVPALVGLRFLA